MKNNGIVYSVSIYRDNGYSQENYTKDFDEEIDALDFFTDQINDEFQDEIEEGLISEYEILSILESRFYVYQDDNYDVSISMEINGNVDKI